jgi:hypothetical protein
MGGHPPHSGGLLMAGRLTRLRLESLEERRLLSAVPVVDINGIDTPGNDFAVERVDLNGLVALVSHDAVVTDDDSTNLTAATVTIANALDGDTLGALVHDTNITASYSLGVLQLSGTDTLTHYQQVLRTVRFNSSAVRNIGDQIDVSFVVFDDTPGGALPSAAAHSLITVVEQGTATVVGRTLFYNNSKYDGHDPSASAADDQAIPPDKLALQQGQPATFANYSTYSRGINGLMIDIAGLHGTISAEDFIFQVGNNNQPDTWFDAPDPIELVVREGAGQGGSDRVEIIWADGAIQNQWLQVRVAANTHTGLATPDTFLFGNSVGESGNSTQDAAVTPVDANRVVNRILHQQTTAPIDDSVDFNRDGLVSPQDVLLSVHHIVTHQSDLALVNVPAIQPQDRNTTISTGIIVTINQPIGPILLYETPMTMTVAGHSATDGSTLDLVTDSITLNPATALSVDGGANGAHSAANPANYQLFKDGAEVPGAVVGVTTTAPDTSGIVALPFISSPVPILLSLAQPLGPGSYRIVMRGSVNKTDGTPFRQIHGEDYSVSFKVASLVRQGDSTALASGHAYAPTVAALPGGEFVVAWNQQSTENPNFYDVYVQRLDANHVPLGAPQLVVPNSSPRGLTVVADSQGNVTVVWNDFGIQARRFAADLTPLGTWTRIDQPGAYGGSFNLVDGSFDATMNAEGDLAVAWRVFRYDGARQNVAQLFDATGEPRGDAFPLGSVGPGSLLGGPKIALDAASNLGAVWRQLDLDGERIVGRIFAADGEPAIDEFTVADGSDNSDLANASIAMDATGNSVVAWQSTLNYQTKVLAQRFDSAGLPQGDPITVQSLDLRISGYSGWQLDQIDATLAASGQFLVAWRQGHDPITQGPQFEPIAAASQFSARVYDATGHPLIDPQVITSDEFTSSAFYSASSPLTVPTAHLATAADGTTMVVWIANDTINQSVRAQTWKLV